MVSLKQAFEPVVDARTRLLVLGSLPGDASLKAAQYYAHPRNAFWRLMGEVVGCDLTSLPYASRLTALKAAGVGLWDVIASAERPGSLDTAIRNASAADLSSLVRSLPDLRAIAFNGGTAGRIGRRRLGESAVVTLVDLPSSSPAHTLAFEFKLQAWRRLQRFVITEQATCGHMPRPKT
ncbi:MAG TPA: DNA-deoxyinosine glycosylase [Brevundimonas sp.]|nr:DNA-deoxyinosine glycosylase [Brevundimonas sp.]